MKTFSEIYAAYNTTVKRLKAEYESLPDVTYAELRPGMVIGAEKQGELYFIERITPSGIAKAHTLDAETWQWRAELVVVPKAYSQSRDLYREGGTFVTKFKLLTPANFEKAHSWHIRILTELTKAKAEEQEQENEVERHKPAQAYADYWNGHLEYARKTSDTEGLRSARMFLGSHGRFSSLWPGTRMELVGGRQHEAERVAVEDFVQEIKANGSAKMKEIEATDPRAKRFIIPLSDYLKASAQ